MPYGLTASAASDGLNAPDAEPRRATGRSSWRRIGMGADERRSLGWNSCPSSVGFEDVSPSVYAERNRVDTGLSDDARSRECGQGRGGLARARVELRLADRDPSGN